MDKEYYISYDSVNFNIGPFNSREEAEEEIIKQKWEEGFVGVREECSFMPIDIDDILETNYCQLHDNYGECSDALELTDDQASRLEKILNEAFFKFFKEEGLFPYPFFNIGEITEIG